MTPRIVLASQSPRRAELLRMLGFTFDVVPADIDETYAGDETGPEHAERLAREKTAFIAKSHRDAVVIGSDTVVVVDNDVLGKPKDEEQAVEMLMRLQGRTHQVATGIALSAPGNKLISDIETVEVKFKPFDAIKAEQYVKTREPMDKAGAYGIQGYGASIVEWVHGDYFAVMGLPIQRMIMMFETLGYEYIFGPVFKVQ
ncbi:MAG TPA: Maf family protein [Longimicrobiales bacterium]|nr:Maf family protein [Longimicrobiales bacterium]